MTTRNKIFDLVKRYLPNEPRVGKGVTLKSLTEKLQAAGVNLITGNKDSSPEKQTIHKSPNNSSEKYTTTNSIKRYPHKDGTIKDQLNLFPYGPGFEQVDLGILESLSDAELGKACQSNKYVAKICSDNEFWRKRLSKVLGYEISRSSNTTKNYREMYKNTVPYLNNIKTFIYNILQYGYLELFKHEYDNLKYEPEFWQKKLGVALIGPSVEILKILISDPGVYYNLLSTVKYTLKNISDPLVDPQKIITESLIYAIELLGKYNLVERVVETGSIDLLDKLNIDISFVEYNKLYNILYLAIASHSLDMVKYLLKLIKSKYKNFTPNFYLLTNAIKKDIMDILPSALGREPIVPIKIAKILVSEMPKLTKGERRTLMKLSILAKSPEHIVYFNELGAKIPEKSFNDILNILARSSNVSVSQFMNIFGDHKASEDKFIDLLEFATRGKNKDLVEYVLSNIDRLAEQTVKKSDMSRYFIEWVIAEGMAQLTELLLSYYPNLNQNILNKFINIAISANLKQPDVNYLDTIRVLLNHGGKIPAFITELAKLDRTSK